MKHYARENQPPWGKLAKVGADMEDLVANREYPEGQTKEDKRIDPFLRLIIRRFVAITMSYTYTRHTHNFL